MSKFDIPRDAAIRKGALANLAARRCMAKPDPDCPELCTEKGIIEGKPVIMVHACGYVSTSAFDAEEGNYPVPQLGELLEIRPLEPEDEFDPRKILVVFQASKLPRTNRAADPAKGTRGPRKPKAETEITDDEAADLARELGLTE